MQVLKGFFQKYFFACIVMAIGLHMTFFAVYGYDLKYIIGDMGDARFIASLIEYNYQWLIGNYSHYWDGFFMFPDKEVISYSDNLLGSLPFYALLRSFDIPFLTAFQLLMLLSHILNFACAYLFFNKATRNKYAAAGGAFVFAFSIVLCGSYNNPQFMFRFCIPLFFYFLQDYLSARQFKDLFWATFFLIFQFYLEIYIGYFLLFFIVLYGICHAIFSHQKLSLAGTKRDLLQISGAAFIFALSVLPVFYFYYKRARLRGYYADYSAVTEAIPRLSSYIRSFPGAFSWKFLNHTDVGVKFIYFHFLFPGGLVFLSILYSGYLAIKGKNRSFYRSLLLLLCLFILLTTLFDGHTCFKVLFDLIPGFKAVRVVSRIVIVAVFFAAWLIGQNLKDVFDKIPKSNYLLIAVLPLVLFLDNYVPAQFFEKKTLKQESRDRMDTLGNKIKHTQSYASYEAFAYVPDTTEASYVIQVDAMLVALDLKIKTVNGYSSACHDNFWPVWTKHDSTSVVDWCKAMKLDPSKVLIIK